MRITTIRFTSFMWASEMRKCWNWLGNESLNTRFMTSCRQWHFTQLFWLSWGGQAILFALAISIRPILKHTITTQCSSETLNGGRYQSWASAGGGQNGHLPPLAIGTKKQKVSVIREISSLILISWVNSCNGSCLPIWHSHSTRVRFTVLVTCSYELAFH